MSDFNILIRVYIEDTDAGGIVYYVNYLKYFERARTEYFRQLGFDKPAFVEGDKLFVVSELSTQYLAPARLDDQLQASVRVTQCKKASLWFQQEIKLAQKVLVSAQIRIACVDQLSMKPVAIPDNILQAIKL